MADWYSFFIELEKCAGEFFHCFHPKILDPSCIPFPARLLTIEQVQNFLHVVNTTANNRAGRNYLCLSIDKLVSLVKIAYLSHKANGKHQSTDNGIKHMISNFKDSNETSFISFSDVPIQEYLEGRVNDIIDKTDQISISDKLPLLFLLTNKITTTLPLQRSTIRTFTESSYWESWKTTFAQWRTFHCSCMDFETSITFLHAMSRSGVFGCYFTFKHQSISSINHLI